MSSPNVSFEVVDGIAFTYVNGVKGLLNRNDAAIITEHARQLPKGAKYVETGAYLGCSTLLVALFSDATVWAHDIWVAEWENNKGASDKECIKTENFFYEFYNAVKKNNLQNRVIPIRGDSAYTLGIHDPETIDLAFIDGDHTYEGALKDFRKIYPLMKKGGVILAHDCTKGGAPLKALIEFSRENDISFEVFPNTTGLARILV
jgi:predicted O-methyltransferase YrrM